MGCHKFAQGLMLYTIRLCTWSHYVFFLFSPFINGTSGGSKVAGAEGWGVYGDRGVCGGGSFCLTHYCIVLQYFFMLLNDYFTG